MSPGWVACPQEGNMSPGVGDVPPGWVAQTWDHIPRVNGSSTSWVTRPQEPLSLPSKAQEGQQQQGGGGGGGRSLGREGPGPQGWVPAPCPCPLTTPPGSVSPCHHIPLPGKARKPGGKKWEPDEDKAAPLEEKTSECPHSQGAAPLPLLREGCPHHLHPPEKCPQVVPPSAWSPTASRMTSSWPPPCCATGWAPSAAASTCRSGWSTP